MLAPAVSRVRLHCFRLTQLGADVSPALDDLRRWLAALPPPPTSVDWTWVESGLGFVLPTDYKEFCDRFGGCRIQWLFVHAPLGQRTLTHGKELLQALFEMPLSGYRAAPGWPDYTTLLLWGEIDSDPVLCWDRTSSSDPDEWRTVVFNSIGTLVRLDGNMTTCIRDMITGRQRPEILGNDFDDPELAVSVHGEQFPVRLDD